jgi:hypothetical protein
MLFKYVAFVCFHVLYLLTYCVIRTLCRFVLEPIAKAEHTEVSEGKAIPLQAWTGPEGSRRLRLPDLKTVGT